MCLQMAKTRKGKKQRVKIDNCPRNDVKVRNNTTTPSTHTLSDVHKHR